MKPNFPVVVAIGLAIFLAGCRKKPAQDETQPAPGQAFNAVQFCQDFSTAPPELKTLADKAWRSVQSGAFPTAVKCLDKLQADPSLNASQKKSAAALNAEVTRQMAAATPAK